MTKRLEEMGGFIRVLLLTPLLLVFGCGHVDVSVPYPDPYEKQVKISGTIDPQLSYRVLVHYHTSNKIRECQSYNYMTGHYQASKLFTYAPGIKADKHELRIPLIELDPNSLCRWRVGGIEINFLRADGIVFARNGLFNLRPWSSGTEVDTINYVCDMLDGRCPTRPDLNARFSPHRFPSPYRFPQVTVNIRVLGPGEPYPEN